MAEKTAVFVSRKGENKKGRCLVCMAMLSAEAEVLNWVCVRLADSAFKLLEHHFPPFIDWVICLQQLGFADGLAPLQQALKSVIRNTMSYTFCSR